MLSCSFLEQFLLLNLKTVKNICGLKQRIETCSEERRIVIDSSNTIVILGFLEMV